MKRVSEMAWSLVVVVGLIAGYLTAQLPRVDAQQATRESMPPVPEWKSQRPAPYLHTGDLTMWPNQPTDGTHWSIDDIRQAHRTMAEAERAGRQVDPNSTLHDFPYWTRTHSMFLNHVPVKASGKRAEQHLGYSQFIVIMGGTGTVQAGGVLQNAVTLQEKGIPMWGEIRGSTITGGETFSVKEGDWISVPPNTPSHVKADSVGGLSYMVMKINAGLYPWELIR